MLGETNNVEYPYLTISSDNQVLSGCMERYGRGNGVELVSIEDFISAMDKMKTTKIVKLTNKYNAEWTEGDDFVKGGCQNIPITKVEELYKVIFKS